MTSFTMTLPVGAYTLRDCDWTVTVICVGTPTVTELGAVTTEFVGTCEIATLGSGMLPHAEPTSEDWTAAFVTEPTEGGAHRMVALPLLSDEAGFEVMRFPLTVAVSSTLPPGQKSVTLMVWVTPT